MNDEKGQARWKSHKEAIYTRNKVEYHCQVKYYLSASVNV